MLQVDFWVEGREKIVVVKAFAKVLANCICSKKPLPASAEVLAIFTRPEIFPKVFSEADAFCKYQQESYEALLPIPDDSKFETEEHLKVDSIHARCLVLPKSALLGASLFERWCGEIIAQLTIQNTPQGTETVILYRLVILKICTLPFSYRQSVIGLSNIDFPESTVEDLQAGWEALCARIRKEYGENAI